MKIKEMLKEDLELMSHNDLTYYILKEAKRKMTTSEIFKTICDLFDYSEQYYFEAIADYYTSLNLDKRFKLIEGIEWDLRENYPTVEEEDEDEEIEEEIDEEEEYTETDLDEDEEDFVDEEIDDDKEDEEFADLTIVDEKDLTE